MTGVSIYLNFMGNTEEAFDLYRTVFGGEFENFQRMRDVPADPSGSNLAEHELDSVLHIELPILGGTKLMGTDMLESMGHTLRVGNNITINLEFDVLAEAERAFALLADDGTDISALTPMFWGAHWGTCCDRFGVRWMFNCPA